MTRSPVKAGKPVVVTVRLLNSGSDSCRLTIDYTTLRVLVTSGSDHIWDTADCRGLPEVPVVLKAKEQRNLAVRWPGVRSRAGCPSGQPAAKPGYYAAEVTVGGVGPVRTRFQLGSDRPWTRFAGWGACRPPVLERPLAAWPFSIRTDPHLGDRSWATGS